jgi:cyanophycinase
MKNKPEFQILLLIIYCLLISSCQGGQKDGKLFIIGGGYVNSIMRDKMIQESGIDKGGYMVILPMSSIEPDTAILETKMVFKEKKNLKIYGFNIIKGESIAQSRIDSIRNASLIFISGGDQSRFMDVIAGTPIKEAIHEAFKNGSLICGTSAGASLMSQKMITGNELKHMDDSTANFNTMEAQNVETIEGLGLLKLAIIDQHFIKRKRLNRLVSLCMENPGKVCIGIDEATAILVDGNKATVYGQNQVIVLRNRASKTTVKDGLLGARKLQLDILLPGDQFRINN